MKIQRSIIFSSFDPGICIMLRQKQKHYPVLFLMSYLNTSAKYMDVRSRDITTAITFCLAEKLNGLCAEIDPIISDLSKIKKMVHSNGLLFMTWGTGNNCSDNIKKQIQCSVDGIIFDRIYDILPTTNT
uniref:Glycerophosphocholine phosphodiesterase GPCPD1 (Trinotate prediction) n=1 Tax=Henneguya salminicola TaxID=69463 RepID=A0A6G3MEP7_HENSL